MADDKTASPANDRGNVGDTDPAVGGAQSNLDKQTSSNQTARGFASMQLGFKGAIVILFLCSILTLNHLHLLDLSARDYANSNFEKAISALIVTRTINAVVSVLQGTQVSAGIGVEASLAVGEFLDPINDLIERFSFIVLVAAVVAGGQKVLLEISQLHGVVWMLSLVLLLWSLSFYRPLSAWLSTGALNLIRLVLTRVLLLLLLLRFALPLFSFIDGWFYQSYLAQSFEQSLTQYDVFGNELSGFNERTDERSLLERIKDGLNFRKELQNLNQSFLALMQDIVNMIVIFLIQVIVLPLVFVWLIGRLIRWLV